MKETKTTFTLVEKLFCIGTPVFMLYGLFLPWSDHLLQYLFSLIPSFE